MAIDSYVFAWSAAGLEPTMTGTPRPIASHITAAPPPGGAPAPPTTGQLWPR